LVLLFIHFFLESELTIMDYVYCFLSIFLLSGVGKTVGKITAYNNLRNDIRELESLLVN
jgi:hypothetical protein